VTLVASPLLQVEELTVAFDGRPVVHGSTFSVAAGEVLAVVGESGSGKTVTALSLLGLLPRTAVVGGRTRLAGTDLFELSTAERRAIRGNRIAMVFQEPISTLNPVFTVGYQVVEALRAHQRISRSRAEQRTAELFELVGLAGSSGPRRLLHAYPHELSGGQLQRIVIAMAVGNDPELLVADEPTTALDVTVQAEVLELLRDLRRRLGMGLLLITHDMGVVADLADRVIVMRSGEIVEEAPVRDLFAAPRHRYTKELLAASGHMPPFVRSEHNPEHRAAPDDPATASVPDTEASPEAPLTLADVHLTYRGRRRSAGVHAVDGVSLHVERGETLGVVGESGSGKSTLASLVAGLLTPDSGSVQVLGHPAGLRRETGRRIGMVFQDPISSLNPRNTVGESIAEPIRLHHVLSGPDVTERVNELLDSVELSANLRDRYPHQLSGGQRQRVCLARALALDPDLVIADEPTSALDTSVQAKILELFDRLQRRFSFAAVFISHDLAVIQRVAHRVAVMHRGHVVELGPTGAVLSEPLHPYTARLLAAAPVADPVEQHRRRDIWRNLVEPTETGVPESGTKIG
jgi:peptide/nickel transport system ATP-binding protein